MASEAQANEEEEEEEDDEASEKPVVNATTRHSGLCVGVFLPVLVFFLIVRQVTRIIFLYILYVYEFWIYSISV